MNKKDIINGLKSRLDSNLSGYPIVWPNVKSEADRPFIEVTITSTSRANTTLRGGTDILREFGIMSAVVVTDLDEGEDTANDIADSIGAIFPAGHKEAITGGTVDILQVPDIRGGFREGNEWRVPVVITYGARAD